MLNERNAFESLNFRGHYIRHANLQAELTRVTTELDRADASFDVVEGLVGGPHVSFRAANLPYHYLRHQNFRLILSEYVPGDRGMHESASFNELNGLAAPLWRSFSTYQSRDLVIRHRDFHLYVDRVGPASPELDRSDATFQPVPGFVPTPETLRIVELVNDKRIFQSAGPRPPLLRPDKRLVAVAEAHSRDLANHPGLWERPLDGFPGHWGSDNSTPGQRIQQALGSPGTENVYIQYFYGTAPVPPPSADAALHWWWYESRPHKDNLLNPGHRSTGVGIATGQGRVPQGHENAGAAATFHYYTQVFHSSP